jgi:hypothetical protein
MGGHEARTYWEDWGLVLLWTSFLAAPFAWIVDQGLSYPLVKWACATGNTYVLTAIGAVALGITVWGGWLGWSSFVRLRGASDDGGTQEDRSYFLALLAIGFNALIAVLVLTAGIPPFVLSPCE